jgi:4-aminobutyrate aminotransferase-like enzyme/Ser/Thr protein kinase RdoA (MazF antagonist)
LNCFGARPGSIAGTLASVTIAAADPLQAPPPAFGIEDAGRIAREVFGLPGSLTPLASERDLNFRLDADRGGSFILKLQNPADDAAVVDFQSRALLHVAQHEPSLPVMRVLPTAEGELWADAPGADGRISRARLFTFLEGRNPAAEELDERALFEWGAMVARLGRALRGFFHPAAGYEILWDLRRAPQLRSLLFYVPDDGRRALASLVLDRFQARVAGPLGALRAQVVHNDMSLDNVLVDERGSITGITDFGDMTHTALVCDLAVTLADVLDGRPDAMDVVEAMIRGYTSITPLDPAEAALLGDLVATRCATAMVISAWRLDLYPQNFDYVSTFGQGSWRLLQLLAGQGFDEVGRRLAAMALPRGVSSRPASPSADLFRRRREVMGSAPLSYRRPLHLVRGEGVWMFDARGRRYLDAYNNVPVVGHAHPRVVEAVAAQTRALNTNTRYLHETVVELSERLVASMPPGLDRVLFVNSGSEANDLALRIARWATARRGVIVSEFAYHGITEATADLSPEEWTAEHRPPGDALLVAAPDGYRGPFRRHDPEWVNRYAGLVGQVAAATPPAAMLVDSAFTSDGVLCPPPAYISQAARIVRDAGGLFIADEVQGGHGRCGDAMWSFQASGVEPDMVTLGKPMGNGYPVAAVVARSDIVDPFAGHTGFFSTFGGNPVAAAASLAVLDVIDDEGLMANAAAVGKHLMGRLRELAGSRPLIGDIRGRGLMIGVELVRDLSTREPARREAAAVVNGMRERGVLIGATGPAENVLKIRPPLVFDADQADLVVETLDSALGSG